MTVKEALKDRIDAMSDDEAAELLARLEWESSETDTLTDDELADVLAAEAEADAHPESLTESGEFFRSLRQ